MLLDTATSDIWLETLVPAGGGWQGAGSNYSDRLRSPAETVAFMRPKFREFGITRLARVTGLDNVGIPVWSAIRPNARTLAQSQGKGIHDDAAQASAVMEAVEVATAERDDFPTIWASSSDILAEGFAVETLDPLLNPGAKTPTQYEQIRWIRGFELIHRQPIYVPLEAATLSDSRSTRRYWQSTDGLASGNSLWEAVVHGLLERVERDAIALWSLRSDEEISARCVDPTSFQDAALDGICAAVQGAGLQVRLFDASCDSKTPVFAAFISLPSDAREHYWKHFDLSCGYGCHLNAVRAAIRAVTEAAQTRLTTISGARDDFDPTLYNQDLDPSLFVYSRSLPKYRPQLARTRNIARRDYIRTLLSRLSAIGVERVIVVPFELGERGFAVARVLVPFLENPPGERERVFGPRAFAFAGAKS